MKDLRDLKDLTIHHAQPAEFSLPPPFSLNALSLLPAAQISLSPARSTGSGSKRPRAAAAPACLPLSSLSLPQLSLSLPACNSTLSPSLPATQLSFPRAFDRAAVSLLQGYLAYKKLPSPRIPQ